MGTDDEHTLYETTRAMGNYISILYAERSKKCGRKRKKTQKAFILFVFAPLKSRTGLFDAPANAFLHARLLCSRQGKVLTNAPKKAS